MFTLRSSFNHITADLVDYRDEQLRSKHVRSGITKRQTIFCGVEVSRRLAYRYGFHGNRFRDGERSSERLVAFGA